MVTPRSWLFCPGDRTDRLAKAVTLADVAVADLEDAVPVPDKETAREAVAHWLRDNPDSARQVWVRVNNDESNLIPDLEALAGMSCAGIVVPKADIETLDDIAARTPLSLLALVETAAGLCELPELAARNRIYSVTLGEYDLAVDLGASSPEIDPEPLVYARAQVVAATAAAGSAPPPAPVSARLGDNTLFQSDTEALFRCGFFGRMCIHPRQVDLTHTAITPDHDEIAQARDLVEAAEQEERQGIGVLVVDGQMVDAPILRRARRVLDLAERS